MKANFSPFTENMITYASDSVHYRDWSTHPPQLAILQVIPLRPQTKERWTSS